VTEVIECMVSRRGISHYATLFSLISCPKDLILDLEMNLCDVLIIS
jgi:hypothetical protein